jgi:hypothetical protein
MVLHVAACSASTSCWAVEQHNSAFCCPASVVVCRMLVLLQTFGWFALTRAALQCVEHTLWLAAGCQCYIMPLPQTCGCCVVAEFQLLETAGTVGCDLAPRVLDCLPAKHLVAHTRPHQHVELLHLSAHAQLVLLQMMRFSTVLRWESTSTCGLREGGSLLCCRWCWLGLSSGNVGKHEHTSAEGGRGPSVRPCGYTLLVDHRATYEGIMFGAVGCQPHACIPFRSTVAWCGC